MRVRVLAGVGLGLFVSAALAVMWALGGAVDAAPPGPDEPSRLSISPTAGPRGTEIEVTITNCTPMGPATNTIMTMSGPGWSLVSGVVDAMSLDTDRTARGSFVVPEVAEGPPGEEFPSGVYRVYGGCGMQDQAFATVPDYVEFEVTDGPVATTTTVPEDPEKTETQATEPGTVPTPAVADPAVTG